MFRTAVASAALALTALPAAAETVISGYTGWQMAQDSRVRLPGPDFDADWKGESLKAPPYWGLRWTNWRGDWGWGAEVTHAKVKASDGTLDGSGLDRLEFTDGLNIVTVNVQRRWQRDGFTPYAGFGIGAAVPHVEVTRGTDRTYGYQLTGPALRWFAGASRDLNDRWSVFAEYQGTHSRNSADLDGGGRLKTDITTHAVNIGLGWRF